MKKKTLQLNGNNELTSEGLWSAESAIARPRESHATALESPTFTTVKKRFFSRIADINVDPENNDILVIKNFASYFCTFFLKLLYSAPIEQMTGSGVERANTSLNPLLPQIHGCIHLFISVCARKPKFLEQLFSWRMAKRK